MYAKLNKYAFLHRTSSGTACTRGLHINYIGFIKINWLIFSIYAYHWCIML